VILRVITRLGFFGPFDRAELRRHFTHQQLEQSRFTDAVFTDDGKTLAGIDRETEVVENLAIRSFVGKGEVLDLDRLAVQLGLLVVVEANPRVLARRRLDVFRLELVDQLDPAGRLLGLGGVGREAADEGLQFGDAFLGLGVGFRLALAGLLRLP
jgi:hypothetical protein